MRMQKQQRLDEAVTYINAMSTMKRNSLFKSLDSESDIGLADDLLSRLRREGISPRTPSDFAHADAASHPDPG